MDRRRALKRARKTFRNPKVASRKKCLLRLYVAGATERSRRAIERARRLCDDEFRGRCTLEIIDVYQQPILAVNGQIFATPTLVREFPRPVRKFIGALENTSRVLVGLNLQHPDKSGR